MSIYDDRVRELEERIAELPAGYISRKNINGSIKKYYQWTEGGKKKSKYMNDEVAEETEYLINRRRELQKELKEAKLKGQLGAKSKRDAGLERSAKSEDAGNESAETTRAEAVSALKFRTSLLLGDTLRRFAETAEGLEKRECFSSLENYLKQKRSGRVFILYGLRRTGKTTMIKQALLSMSEEDFGKAAFIQVKAGDTLGDVNSDMKLLLENGYRYVFVDEVTLAEDFIEGSALLSDIYASSGMKVVLSGTDSLGFVFSEDEELYDRCIMLHTTFIPYREFERVLGIAGIDEYIRYGGTMSLGGVHYNEPVTFASKASTDDYIDSAIARNIQHSLRYYQDGGHFRSLAELYDRNELTSAINRVIEDINHRFIIDVLAQDFVPDGLRRMLEIRNKDEQSVRITDAHCAEIKEYLDLLDLTVDISTEYIPVRNEKSFRTAVAQPGLRYAQASALIRQLLLDEEFMSISAVERAKVTERILTEIRGRMMEDIILLETMKAYPDKDVFKLQFAVGEFDMVIADPLAVTCELFEIKHSTEAVPEQCRHLTDTEKLEAAEFRYGTITGRYVIYRGKSKKVGDIRYMNVEDYLKKLKSY
ncbi:MAG: AAA family ATPase [Eubacterium sp.]|nr:AAA family ATPase [Eubacterium sp.]